MDKDRMTYDQAVEKLKGAKSVSHWNEIREELKSLVSTSDITRIDTSGLIVKVLGPDYATRKFTEDVSSEN